MIIFWLYSSCSNTLRIMVHDVAEGNLPWQLCLIKPAYLLEGWLPLVKGPLYCVGPPLISQFWERQEGQLQEASCFLVGVAGLNFILWNIWRGIGKHVERIMGFFSACISAFLGNGSQVTLSRNWGLNGIYIVVIEDFPFNLFFVFANGANCSF